MQTVKEFIEENREAFLAHARRLIAVDSTKGAPEDGAPFGAGVHKCELEAMKIAEELGFEEVHDCEGYMAYAHVGPKDHYIGIIGHLDIVPVGDGWFHDPFDMLEKEGYIMGRGTTDDKVPLLTSMYAVKYLIDNKIPLRYGIRVLMGCDEESGMEDLTYYLKHNEEPDFTYSPDAWFPVGNGEKGIYSSDIVSEPVDGAIVSMDGGIASNVIPDHSTVVLRGVDAGKLCRAAGDSSAYKITEVAGDVKVEAFGKMAHAGFPWGSENSNRLVLDLVRDAGVLEGREKEIVDFFCGVLDDFLGTYLGIAGEDGRFDPTTLIGGMIRKTEDGRLLLNVDSRYNTSITPEELESRISGKAASCGLEVRNVSNSGSFYISPDAEPIRVLSRSFNEVTGRNDVPYVMNGGTYARHMHNAVSFGPEMNYEVKPEWAGSPHMRDEAISLQCVFQSIAIYAESLLGLEKLDSLK